MARQKKSSSLDFGKSGANSGFPAMFLDMGEWYCGEDFPPGRYRFSCRQREGAYANVNITRGDAGGISPLYMLDYDEGKTSCVCKLNVGDSVEISGGKVRMTPYSPSSF